MVIWIAILLLGTMLVCESALLIKAHMLLRMNNKIQKNTKKLKKMIFFVMNIDECSKSVQNFRFKTFVDVWAKITKSMLQNASNNSLFGPSILFFCLDLHECHFNMKFCTQLEHSSMFITKNIRIFYFLGLYCSCRSM